MKTEITIEAVSIKSGNCAGCIFSYGGIDCDDLVDALVKTDLPDCDDGYIYKIKEVKDV